MGVLCTELKPGNNIQVKPEPKDTGPPEGFIDNNVKVYKMIDGVKTLIRTEDPFPEGWDKPAPFQIISNAESEERRRDHMGKKVKLEVPADIEQVWAEVNYSVNGVATKYGVGWPTARGWLQEAGLLDETKKAAAVNQDFEQAFDKQEQEQSQPDPEQAANQEPDQTDDGTADTCIPEKEITVKDVLLYEVEHQDGFPAADNEPIPYTVATVAPKFDLTPVKLQLIAATLAEFREGCCPAYVTLQVIKQISFMEVRI